MAYNEDSIEVYEGLEGVRKKPTLYVGALGSNSLLQILKEAVENSSDEAMAGYNDFIMVQVEGKPGKQEFVVYDKGRGIPVKKHKKTKISTLTTVMTRLHAGGKFDEKSYKASRGTFGVGISVTNALSTKFEVWTCRNKIWYYQCFKKGEEVKKVSKSKPPTKYLKYAKKGTIIKFSPDYSILGKRAVVTKKVLEDWLYDIAYLNFGLKVRLKIGKYDETFYNKGGPKEYLNEIIGEEEVTKIGKPFIFESENLTLAIQWTDYEGDDGIYSFVNGSYTNEGGTHLLGLNDAISKSFRSVSSKTGWSIQEIKYGILGFINFKLNNAEFDSQTKSKLVTASAKKQVSELLQDDLTAFLEKNTSTTNSIIKRAIEIKKAKIQSRELTKAASKIRNNKKILLPGKLIMSDKKTAPAQRELYCVEGASAGGGSKKARDPKTQEILLFKGKLINAEKQSRVKVLANKEIQNMLMAIGVDLKTKESNYRVGKIIINSDADPDGLNISVLVLTALYKLCPDVYDKGMVYVVDSPLFVASWKDKRWFGQTLKEVKKKAHKSATVTRLKGLGECSFQDLRSFAFDKKTRRMFKIKPIKSKDKQKFLKVVGEDTTERKKILGIA
jgi:DNA gyrase subunit B